MPVRTIKRRRDNERGAVNCSVIAFPSSQRFLVAQPAPWLWKQWPSYDLVDNPLAVSAHHIPIDTVRTNRVVSAPASIVDNPVTTFKVVIADPPGADHEVEAAALAASGLALESVWLDARDADRVLEHAADADALVMSWVPMTREVIGQLQRCRVIARFGIGVDMIDLDAATERGILVCNTATYCLDEVSNHAMGLLLMLNRGLLQDVDALRSGGWFRSTSVPPRRLAGQRLGLVGLGNIGRLVARKARGFGLDVVAYDPYLRGREPDVDGTALVDLDELLECADIVSVHCPL